MCTQCRHGCRAYDVSKLSGCWRESRTYRKRIDLEVEDVSEIPNDGMICLLGITYWVVATL